MALVIRSLHVSAGDLRDAGSIPGSGRSPGGGNGNPLQCSCLENPMDRGAWWATVHGATKSQTRLQRLRMYAQLHGCHSSLRSFLLCWSWSLGLWVSQKIHGSEETVLFTNAWLFPASSYRCMFSGEEGNRGWNKTKMQSCSLFVSICIPCTYLQETHTELLCLC